MTPLRPGPRPLGVHLTAALVPWMSSLGAWPLWSSGWLPSNPAAPRQPDPVAESLRAELAAVPPDRFAAALQKEVLRRTDRLLAGIERYRRHPYRRDLPEPDVAWRHGAAVLYDYGGSGVPVLAVPSLINRGYVMDLSERRSFLRFLAGQGLRPFLLEWGRPGDMERGWGLDQYVGTALSAALDAVIAATGRPPAVLGYCMGGLLALGLAALRPRDVAALALLATPWDFHATESGDAERLASLHALWGPAIDSWGEMPVDAIQYLFAAIDPWQVPRKFMRFADADPDSPQAADFVALEDWLNDGIPLAAPVARECLVGWYGENRPGRGEWTVAGVPVRPRDVAIRALVVVPARDRIVPPASAEALATSLPGAEALRLDLGHIGMMVGGSAPARLWAPLADWLRRS